MKNNDAELIQRVLAGDDTAFSALVKKHQKSVHALAWRKTGDFHVAEEITQDTFLKVYQNLSTLKEPQKVRRLALCDSGRTTARCGCVRNVYQRSRWKTQCSAELEKATYSGYVIAGKRADNGRITTRSRQGTTREVTRE